MWLILRKELLELVRDRRSLFCLLLLPVLVFPVIFGGVAYFAQQAVVEAEAKVLQYGVLHAQQYPEFAAALAADDSLQQVDIEPQSWRRAVQQGQIDFVVELAEQAGAPVLEVGQIAIQLYLNDAGLNNVHARVSGILAQFQQRKRAAAFAALQVSPDKTQALIAPLLLKKVNLADDREDLGEKIGGIIPYLVFILLLQGVMHIAADLGAGEKERGTLETLLLAPVSRVDIVFGKFFAIAIAGITAVVVAMVSMLMWGMALAQHQAIAALDGLLQSIGLMDVALILLMLLPVVAIFAAITLSLSIFAKSYKEAQTYMGVLMLTAFLPIIFSILPGVTLQGPWAWVPLTNIALAMKELIKGTMDYTALAAIFISTTAIAVVCLIFCVYWFKREKVLFR